MSDGDVIATVETDPRVAVLDRLGLVVLVGIAAVGLVAIVWQQLGSSSPVVPVTVGAAVFGLGVLGTYISSRNRTITFHSDSVTSARQRLAYDDISLAVRADTPWWRRFGTADFEVIAHDDENLTLEYVSDPAAVERHLTEQVSAPATQLEEKPRKYRNRGETRDYMLERWVFWEYWDARHRLPDEPVVGADTLAGVLGVSVRRADLDRLDDLSMGGARHLGDIEAEAVDAEKNRWSHWSFGGESDWGDILGDGE